MTTCRTELLKTALRSAFVQSMSACTLANRHSEDSSHNAWPLVWQLLLVYFSRDLSCFEKPLTIFQQKGELSVLPPLFLNAGFSRYNLKVGRPQGTFKSNVH